MYTEESDMSSYQCRTAIEVMNQLEGVNLHEKRGGKFHFYMQLTKAMKETPIEALDLSPRSFNSLKRADYHTIGDVANAIAAGKDLRTIRNCGAKSIREIMEHLFLYQYDSLPADRQTDYLVEVAKRNLER